MSGYLGSQELTSNAFFEGGFRTGDMGDLNEEGYLFLVDRKKDMIIISDFNVYPAEIEDYLCDHPGILEACVVSVPPPDVRHMRGLLFGSV